MRQLWVATSLLFALSAGTVAGVSIYRDRANVIDLATERTYSTAQLIALHGESAIEDANKIVTVAVSRVADWDLKDPAKGRELSREMKRLSVDSPHIFATWISDAQGVNVADSLSEDPAPINAAERPFFLAHLKGAPEPVIMAEPTPGAISGKPRFTFSRSARNPDGSLKAVVACAMHSDYFDTLYRMTVNWVDGRGGLYMNARPLARKSDQSNASRSFVEAITREVTAAPSGSALIPEGSDQRLISWAHMERYPKIYATASISIGPLLAEWRGRSYTTVLITLAAIVAFAAFIRTWAHASHDRARIALTETTVREVHHRVRNSLQMVTSILMLRSRSVDAHTRAALDDVRLQIDAIAEAHRLLQTTAELERVDLADIIAKLCAHIPHAEEIRLSCETQPAMVSGDVAPSLAIIANELITNALKHAATDVRVTLSSSADGLLLCVADDGPGLPSNFAIDQMRGFGLRAIRLMSEKIGGTLAWSARPGGGTSFTLTCRPLV